MPAGNGLVAGMSMTTTAPATERERIAREVHAFYEWRLWPKERYAVADYILEREAALREKCARECDAWLAEHADEDLHHVSAREWATAALEDVATCIREGAQP